MEQRKRRRGFSTSSEVYERRNKAGNLNDLIVYLSTETGVKEEDIKDKLYLYIGMLTDGIRRIITKHYLYEMSVVEIYYDTRVSMSRIDNYITKGKEQIVNIIKEEYNNDGSK